MDEYMGVIKLFAFNYAPQNWMPCNGQTLPIAQYQALFSLLGTMYGGNGQTDFALPKLDASSIHEGLQYCICYQGIYPSRQ
ncbi:phage tail protein [Acidicapsa dinghuensis]|uniref:Phage tail protein n=1 Tax=Acidicapsa dinghuensis TaxID=2218256 RepID=A0ABW1EJR7_9BACT|nr:tail fiber protein [Acidicapsa dinghuensis]